MEVKMTIEINRFDYENESYESPKGSPAESPQEWKDYWIRCMADYNLEGLKSISEDSFLIDIETIKDYELEGILMQRLKEVDLDDFEEQVGIFCGGIMVSENDTILIEPNCCGDLGNFKDWESIFDSETDNWIPLWIGHPWLYYRKINSTVEFYEYTESSVGEFHDIKTVIRFPELEL